MLNLITDYCINYTHMGLVSRKQCAVVNGVPSEWKDVTNGMHKAVCLEPFFLLCI